MRPEGLPMPEPKERPPLKIHDAPYTYRGYYDAEPAGLSQVRLFSRPSARPVIVITDLPENPTTSVTNLMETLVPELIRDLGKTAWFEEAQPPIVIEHLPPLNPRDQRDQLSEYRRTDEYSEATFTNWRPKTIWIGGRERLSLGEPNWRYMRREEVVSLIGEDEVPVPQPPQVRPDAHLEDHDAWQQRGDID